MHRVLLLVPCSFWAVSACQSSSPSDVSSLQDAPLAVDTHAPLDAERSDGAVPSLSFVHDWREADLCAVGEPPVPSCCEGTRIELPRTAASRLDLRALTTGDPGTCGDPVKRILPSEASAYPLMVLLPEVSASDPFCATACAGRGVETAFGIVLALPESLSEVYRPLVVVPAPWRYVYDHNSLAGDACLGGYQEFGERACVRPNYGGFIGFATSEAATPVRAALIDLQRGENGAVPTCCPYLPTMP